MTFVTPAPAKINLTLDVGPREADGYHALRSIFLRLGLADRLTTTIDRSAVADGLLVDGPPDCPVEGNLILAALDLVRRRIGEALPALHVHLAKRVPVGGGLGGGSSDAAAALGIAEACWGVGLSPGERLALAVALGSDVPFFAADVPAALVEGRGEQVAPLPGIVGEAGVLLAVPALSMATGRVFERLDELRVNSPHAGRAPATDELAGAFRDGLDGAGLAGYAERLRDANDLWPAARAIEPPLARLRDALETATGGPWLLTGSGSTLFALHRTVAEAAAAGVETSGRLGGRFAGLRLLADNLHAPDPAWRYP